MEAAQLDHLVWAVPDLARGVDQVRDALGVEPPVGGSHVGLGTRNHLLGLGDRAYLEVIGPDPTQPAPPGPRPFGVDGTDRPRLVTFAVRVDDLDTTTDELQTLGHDPGPYHSMQRALPDGGLLSWRLTDPPEWGGGVVPFLIDWGQSPHPSRTLPTGARLEHLRAWHPDPIRVRTAWSALGIDFIVDAGLRLGWRRPSTDPAGRSASVAR